MLLGAYAYPTIRSLINDVVMYQSYLDEGAKKEEVGGWSKYFEVHSPTLKHRSLRSRRQRRSNYAPVLLCSSQCRAIIQ